MHLLKKISVFCLVVFYMSGCTSYETSDPLIRNYQFYPYRVETNSLQIIIDPYEAKGKVINVFGTDVRELDILPIHLIVMNQSLESLSLSQLDVRLFDGETGQRVELLNAMEVAREAKFDMAKRVMGFAAAGTGLLIMTIPFAVSAGYTTHTANSAMQSRFDKESHVLDVVEPGTTMDGFLFFRVSDTRILSRSMLTRPYVVQIAGMKLGDNTPIETIQIRVLPTRR